MIRFTLTAEDAIEVISALTDAADDMHEAIIGSRDEDDIAAFQKRLNTYERLAKELAAQLRSQEG